MNANAAQRLLSLAPLALLVACGAESREPPSAPAVAVPDVAALRRPEAPSPRGYPLVVYDPVKDRVYDVGGFSTLCWDNCDGIELDDLWSFDPRARRWSEVAGVLPPLEGDAVALDYRSRHIIMIQPFYGPMATWAYDLERGTWENRNPAVEPPARWGSMMVYDPRADRVLLYGGTDLNDGTTVLSDLWAYDYGSNTWTERHPPVSPPGHHFPALVYVPTTDRVILFGGFRQGFEALFNDTWAYDYRRNRWTDLHPRNPPAPRAYHLMGFEPATNRLVMFGGILDPANWPYEPTINETWTYDVGANRWSEVFPKISPGPRAWHGMTGTDGPVVVFGGGDSRFTYTNDTFLFTSRSNTWQQVPGGSTAARLTAGVPSSDRRSPARLVGRGR